MFAVIDLETTGKDHWRNEILTIACILTDPNFNELETFTASIKPEESTWDEEAEKVHGISRKQAKAFDNNLDVLDRFCDVLGSYGEGRNWSFVCHALPFRSRIDLFDYNFIFAWFWKKDKREDLYRFFPEELIYSTIHKKRNHATTQYQIENQKLSTWASKLDITFEHHTALDDAKVCLEVLKYQKGNQGRFDAKNIQEEKEAQKWKMKTGEFLLNA